MRLKTVCWQTSSISLTQGFLLDLLVIYLFRFIICKHIMYVTCIFKCTSSRVLGLAIAGPSTIPTWQPGALRCREFLIHSKSKRTVENATAEIRNAAQFDIEKNCEESAVLSAQRFFWSSEKIEVSSTFGFCLKCCQLVLDSWYELGSRPNSLGRLT